MSISDRKLVERFGSPLYVYDEALLRARWGALREALPPEVDIHYAMKANPSLGILALLRGYGSGVEIASRGELLAARRAGFAAERILWAGPGKTDDEHLAAVASGILAIHAESDSELRRLDALGRSLGRRVRVGVRIHVPWEAAEAHRIIGGSAATKFGIPLEEALQRAGAWSRLEGVLVEGLHVFNASNVRDADALARSARRTLGIGARLRAAGLPLVRVDVGGGLGVPYSADEEPLDVNALGLGLARALEASRIEDGFAPRLVIEPGRYLVAESGRLICTVIDRKSCAGVEFLVVDTGVHHLLRPALVGQAHPVMRCGRSAGVRRHYRIVGPLCTSLDDLGLHELPECAPGDLLAIGCAGAYGYTESMPLFLSHPMPAEVLVRDGAAHLLRPRVEPESVLDHQSMP